MATDPLQIALEHHRTGRLQRAEAGYRSILESDPGHPEAMHWVGVLAHQAGRPNEAIFWLEQAAAIRSKDAAYQHNLGHAYLSAGNITAAIQTFEKALKIDPLRSESWAGLGISYLRRSSPDDGKAAVAALIQAHATGLDSAELHHQLGVALLSTGIVSHAIQSLRKSIEKDPHFVPAYHHLALALRCTAETDEARRVLLEAVEKQPAFARAWHGLGVVEGEAGHHEAAIEYFQKAIAIDPNYAAAYHGLAHVLQATGRQRESLAMFRRSLATSRATRQPPAAETDRSLSSSVAALERRIAQDSVGADLHYTLATLTSIFAPPRVPDWAVTNLFNSYADNFDQHLRGQLQYRVPELIAEAVAEVTGDEPLRLLDILDLGCGTGLCGTLLRPFAANLTGIDLAPAMIEKAKERNLYDRLEVGDLVTHLQKYPDSFDLLVAGDVLNYVGDLSPAFEAARAALRVKGRFALTVEAGSGDRYTLRQSSRRYKHAKSYLQHLARIYGFTEERFDDVTLRHESNQPVSGYLVMLRIVPG